MLLIDIYYWRSSKDLKSLGNRIVKLHLVILKSNKPRQTITVPEAASSKHPT
jgi:hypothetical protein